MRMIDPEQLTRSFSRSYAEDCGIALSAIDCALNGERGVYASTELTSGRRVNTVLREVGLTSSSDLRRHLGEDSYTTRVWNPNLAEGAAFARRLHHSLGGNQIVVTPGPFTAPGWKQLEYLAFWETLIRTRIRAIYFNDGWEFSNGCAFEFLVAVDAGVPTFDATNAELDVTGAIARIESAVVYLKGHQLEFADLVKVLALLKERAVLNRSTHAR
jgi:hypothetical protein